MVLMSVYSSMSLLAMAGDQTEVLLTKNNLVQETASGATSFLKEGISFRMDLLSYGTLRDPVDDSRLNAGNWLGISTWQKEVSVRPDIGLDLERFSFFVKPRGGVVYQKWTKGPLDGNSNTAEDFFVNEWLARVILTDELFISYGRENLQWGPAFLISPSNPFIKDNGRDNPKKEVAGLGYTRLLWVPHTNWSASLIANLDDGANSFFSRFNRKYAMKIDFTGFQKYWSMVLSHEESGCDTMGFLGGWSFSDAMLVYGESSVKTEYSHASDGVDLDFLVGGSYTFKTGPTLACEYFYNKNGNTDLIHGAFLSSNPVNPDDVLIRKNYGMMQLSEFKFKESVDYVLRWILDLDDGSNRFVGMLEYEMGDHWKIFGIGDIFSGSTDDEFGSLNDYSICTGLQWSY